jgi:predicted PurR-regulated permease PerM
MPPLPMTNDEHGWWSRERVLLVTLFAATALAFYVCYLLVLPFLPALTWALALAIVAHPLHTWFAARIRSENVAAALAVLVVSIIIVAPTIFVSHRLGREALAGVETAKALIETGEWRTAVESDPRLGAALAWLEQSVDLRAQAERLTAEVVPRIGSVVRGSIWAATELLITLFTLFFFFRDRHAAVGALRSLVPLSETETDEVVTRVADSIHATVFGTLGVALVQGTLGGLMFWFLGLPSPLVWGAVMALLALVPVMGTALVWAPAAALLAVSGDWGRAAILAGWGLVAISLGDNLLYPLFVGRRMQMHVLPVFLAVLGGLAAFGAAGLVLGPMALALTVALVDIWRRRMAGGRAAEVPGREEIPTTEYTE